MSKLEELIDSLCPNGVSYVNLSEVAKIRNGSDYKGFHDGAIPVYGSGGIIAHVDHFAYDRPSVLIPRKGSINKLYYVDGPFWNVDTIFYTVVNEDRLIPKFLFYVLSSRRLERLNDSGGVPSLTQKKLNQINVPVPPLEAQHEIVRILDDFTKVAEDLSVQLATELTARQKQYDCYLNDLLSFDDAVLSYRVGDLFDFKNGLSKGKEFFGRGSFIVKYTDVYKNRRITQGILSDRVECNEKELQSLGVRRGDVFFTRTSETRDEVGIASVMLDEVEDCVFSGFLLRGRPKTDLLLPEYCAYCFATKEVRSFISSATPFTTRASLSGAILSQMKISVPSIEKQRAIVKLLDSFENVVNVLSDGLHAEIAARQKQYEFYRDKLLNFGRVCNE